MNLSEVMIALEEFGDERTKNTFFNHGAQEPLFGVKVGDLKKLTKKIKKDHDLSLQSVVTSCRLWLIHFVISISWYDGVGSPLG